MSELLEPMAFFFMGVVVGMAIGAVLAYVDQARWHREVERWLRGLRRGR